MSVPETLWTFSGILWNRQLPTDSRTLHNSIILHNHHHVVMRTIVQSFNGEKVSLDDHVVTQLPKKDNSEKSCRLPRVYGETMTFIYLLGKSTKRILWMWL